MPNDDPSIKGYADANLMAARLKAFADAIRAYVLASYPSAVFALLWPMDVNDLDVNCLPPGKRAPFAYIAPT